MPRYEKELDAYWDALNHDRDWLTRQAYPLSNQWLAEQLSLSEFMLPGGTRSPQAYALKELVDDLVEYGTGTTSDLVAPRPSLALRRR